MKHIEKAVDYKRLDISSAVFKEGQLIPSKYTCDGANVNPSLEIKNIPVETKCLTVIVEDPDAPAGTWVHWVVWNIPVTHHIKENSVQGIEGINDFQKHQYRGPCPPSGTHHYYFKIYALDTLLELPVTTKKTQLEKAMSEHIIAFGELIGLYKRD